VQVIQPLRSQQRHKRWLPSWLSAEADRTDFFTNLPNLRNHFFSNCFEDLGFNRDSQAARTGWMLATTPGFTVSSWVTVYFFQQSSVGPAFSFGERQSFEFVVHFDF